MTTPPSYETRAHLDPLVFQRCGENKTIAESEPDAIFYPPEDLLERPLDKPTFYVKLGKTAVEVSELSESAFLVGLLNPDGTADFPHFKLDEWMDEQAGVNIEPAGLFKLMLRVTSLDTHLEFKLGGRLYEGILPSVRGLQTLEGILDGGEVLPAPQGEPRQPQNQA